MPELRARSPVGGVQEAADQATGIDSAAVPKKLLLLASIHNCYTSARRCTASLGNVAEATFEAISKTYSYLTPDLWKETKFTKSPYQATGIDSAAVPKKLLLLASIHNCYTSARRCTASLGNFAEATFEAISKTYSYLTPDLWKETKFTKSPYQ
ncbi:40S ribosomal protein S2 [Myotis davidii]|uniref:40S ribosomal protein S2 n=1 Tax=Myotis davidii TaxID=225400 RepID=L5LQY8_MYODS|nr:40S ribosomal protein S2 [Myotis davidii]